jgi:hypothetical protein
MALSFESVHNRNESKLSILYKVVRRSVILFALGIFIVNAPTNWQRLRIMGVLQRFAIGYLIVGLMRTFTHNRAELVHAKQDQLRVGPSSSLNRHIAGPVRCTAQHIRVDDRTVVVLGRVDNHWRPIRCVGGIHIPTARTRVSYVSFVTRCVVLYCKLAFIRIIMVTI